MAAVAPTEETYSGQDLGNIEELGVSQRPIDGRDIAIADRREENGGNLAEASDQSHSSFETTDEEQQRNSAIRRYMRRGANGTCALLLITVLFVLALYWAAKNWSTASGKTPTWTRTQCRVRDIVAEVRPSFRGPEKLWRSKFAVDFYAKKKALTGYNLFRQKVAWRWQTPVFNVTEKEALEYQSSFSSGQNYTCWVIFDRKETSQLVEDELDRVAGKTGIGAWKVSMSPVVSHKSEGIGIALVSTCVVALLLLSFLIALTYAVSTAELLQEVDRPPDQPGTIQPHAFTAAQVKGICSVAFYRAKRDENEVGMFDGEPWNCSICLDDEGGEGGGLAQLDCRHVFHKKCVRRWLFRGGVTCPLCNFRLKAVNEEGLSQAKVLAIEAGSTLSDGEGNRHSSVSYLVPDIAVAIMSMHAPPEPAYRGRNSSLRPESAQMNEDGNSKSSDSMSDLDVPSFHVRVISTSAPDKAMKSPACSKIDTMPHQKKLLSISGRVGSGSGTSSSVLMDANTVEDIKYCTACTSCNEPCSCQSSNSLNPQLSVNNLVAKISTHEPKSAMPTGSGPLSSHNGLKESMSFEWAVSKHNQRSKEPY